VDVVKVVGLNLLKFYKQVEEISEQIIECSWLHHKHLLKVKARKVLIAETFIQVNLKLRILCFSFIE
jgi:hypothetical protein